MMDLLKIETEAGEHAQQVLELMSEHDGPALEECLRPLDRDQLRWVIYALAAGLLGQEEKNELLEARIRTLGVGMSSLLVDRDKLSADRQALADDLASVREDRENQARLLARYREKTGRL